MLVRHVACMREKRKVYSILVGALKIIEYLEELWLNVRIISELILNKE